MSEAPSIVETRPRPGDPVHPRRPTLLGAPNKKKSQSDLVPRLLTACVLVTFVIYMIYLGGLFTVGTVVLVVLLGQREFYRLIEGKGAHPLVGFGLAAGGALPVVAYLGNEYHATVLMTMTLLVVMVAQLGKAQIGESLASVSGTFFGVFYVGWLLSHAVPLREFYANALSRYGAAGVAEVGLVPQAGAYFLFFALAVVVFCDTGAYFAGRAYGRRKLAPRISPGKSVEGAIGGICAGVAGGLASRGVFEIFWPELSQVISWGATLFFSVVLTVVGIVGDLVESLLKRDAQVKDTGRSLPGMGGILDRIDAPLLAVPMMYYMLHLYVYLRLA